jgi:hypothetical protein
MKRPKLDVTRSMSELLADRRTFLGKAGTLSLSAVFAALGAAEAAAAFGPVPPPSSYTTLLGLCTPGSGTTTYTPGVTNILQPIHIDATVIYPPCAVAQNKTVMQVRSSIDLIASCSGQTDQSGTSTIAYGSGQNSSVTTDSWSSTRLLGQAVAVSSGLITNGPFNGARAWHLTMRNVRNPGACASAGGVTSSTGTNTLILAQ